MDACRVARPCDERSDRPLAVAPAVVRADARCRSREDIVIAGEHADLAVAVAGSPVRSLLLLGLQDDPSHQKGELICRVSEDAEKLCDVAAWPESGKKKRGKGSLPKGGERQERGSRDVEEHVKKKLQATVEVHCRRAVATW